MSGRPSFSLASVRQTTESRRLSRVAAASLSVLALVAGLFVAPAVGLQGAQPASADSTTNFPVPEHHIERSYEDLTGVHVPTAEPTIYIESFDLEEPEGGYLSYGLDLEISATETEPTLVAQSLVPVGDGGYREVTWTAPEGLFGFGETYVMRYRLTTSTEQSAWAGWFPFSVTAPSVAPTQLSPTAGALSTSPVQLVAQIPGYTTIPDSYDTVIFTVQEAWQNGEPLVVSQMEAEIDDDGVVRSPFSAPEGAYRWNVQWVGMGFSEPSEFRELTVSKKAPPVSYLYVTSDRLAATVRWQFDTIPRAPVQYVDVTVTPGDITHRVSATSASTTFTDLPVGDYMASVAATNALGTSSAVTKTFTVTRNSPTSPTNLLAIAANGATTAHVTWDSPVNDGGAPISRFYVDVRSYDGGKSQSFYTADLFADIAVQTGFTYLIIIQAENEIGLSEQAATRLEVFGVPSAPQNIVVNPGDSFVNLYWDTPANVGGKTVTKYRVTVHGVGTYTTIAYYGRQGIQINDLQNGHRYAVSISAINEIGPGPVAKVTDVIPVSSEADADADGLPDVVEARFGTSSSLSDTDNDGISDVDETLKLSAYLSPTIADTDADGTIDAQEDSDADGIANDIELSASTNPSSPDSDRDSLTDAAEATAGTNPTAADSDADGIDDASELASGLNPTEADTDGDGITDFDTIATQTIADIRQYAPQTGPQPELDLASELSGVSAAISGPAGRLDDITVSSSPADDLAGALTSVASVMDAGADLPADAAPVLTPSLVDASSADAEPTVAHLTFGYAANVSPDRLQDLAPVSWNPGTYSWEFVDNDVSLSTADHTISILSPQLGLRYAVVDLHSWRAHISECDHGSNGRPQLDVEFVIDGMPSVVLGDTTNERFTAARAVVDSLKPGDTASVREFGLMPLEFSGGGGAWQFDNGVGTSLLTEEERFGLNSLERAQIELTALSDKWVHADTSRFPSSDVGWDLERVLHGTEGNPVAVNPYVPTATPMECRKKVVVLITDGGQWSDEPDTQPSFAEKGIPVHVLDLGIGSPESSAMLAAVADETDGTYSYIPTQSDLDDWIEEVSPLARPSGDPNRDTDRDTIPDMVETYGIIGTMNGGGERFYSHPRKADSDGDGIPDNIEIGQRLSVGTQGAAWTTATINRNYWVISDPGSKDGDTDGLDDRAEIDANMNPLLRDGDGDGLIDGIEEQYGTFSQMYDTDSDGFSDTYEVYHEADGYDPREYNERVSEYEWLSEAAIGFFCGEVDICSMTTIPWLVGNIASGLLIFGDLRDSIGLIVKGDFISASFCMVGLIPAVGDVVGTLAKVAKFVNKILSPFGLRTAGMAAGAIANAGINVNQAMKMLRYFAGTPAKFVSELAKIEPQLVDWLRTTNKIGDSGITKLIMSNGLYRFKGYQALDPSMVRVYTYTATTLPKVLANGKAGETALQKLVPELVGYKQVRDVVRIKNAQGAFVDKIRYWDGKYTVGDAVHYLEAKVGYVASGFSYSQAAKDIAQKIAKDGGVFEWHFYASSISGKIGPSLPFLKALTDAGITVVFHLPGGAL